MKTWLIGLFAAVLVGAGGLWLIESPLGRSETAWLAERSIDFVEDLQFKDFAKASTYHLPETQKARDIPELIRSVFLVRHEQLDIVDYKVLEVDLDRSKTRARVRVLVNYRLLGDRSTRESPQAQRDVEMLLYWFKQASGVWAMELESSLRR